MTAAAFHIVPHPEGILEVVYPATPTTHDVIEYLHAMRHAIDAQPAAWMCLVDQRAMHIIPPAIGERLSVLNRYARGRGMSKSARVVASSAAAIQAKRLAIEAGVANVVSTFTSREEAWKWLTT